MPQAELDALLRGGADGASCFRKGLSERLLMGIERYSKAICLRHPVIWLRR